MASSEFIPLESTSTEQRLVDVYSRTSNLLKSASVLSLFKLTKTLYEGKMIIC